LCQQSFGFNTAITLNLRPNARRSIVWGGCTVFQELNLCRRLETPAIGFGIEHCATGNSVLFGGIAQNEPIAHEGQNR
jgi:hypothetical protein